MFYKSIFYFILNMFHLITSIMYYFRRSKEVQVIGLRYSNSQVRELNCEIFNNNIDYIGVNSWKNTILMCNDLKEMTKEDIKLTADIDINN